MRINVTHNKIEIFSRYLIVLRKKKVQEAEKQKHTEPQKHIGKIGNGTVLGNDIVVKKRRVAPISVEIITDGKIICKVVTKCSHNIFGPENSRYHRDVKAAHFTLERK